MILTRHMMSEIGFDEVSLHLQIEKTFGISQYQFWALHFGLVCDSKSVGIWGTTPLAYEYAWHILRLLSPRTDVPGRKDL